MRQAPNWIHGEAVDGKWKQELLIFLGEKFNLKTLIETGTCDGGTLSGVYEFFDACHSIELSEHYFRISKERFKHAGNVRIYQGNSAEKLREVLLNIPNTPTLFWLDAHPSGGLTANEGDPLPEELKAIMELRPDGLVVIDDQLTADLGNCHEIDFAGWSREFHFGVAFVFKKGLYEIPPFISL